MNALEMLKLGGCANTTKGRAEFHKKYPTPKHFFAKHGGQLSGAPYNGQPTAEEFFSWGQPIIGPQGFYADGGSNKMKLSNDEVVQMATKLFKSPYSSLNMEDYNKLSEADKTRVRSIYDNASKYSAGSKGKFPFTPGSSAYWKSDLKDASDSAEYLSGYQRGEPLNREESIGRAMFIQDDLDDGQPSILNPTMSGEFQRNDDYEKMGQGWSPKKMGGDVEYNRALALVTKAMGGQAGVEMRSTNDYLQNENGYLTDYLNQGQQQFMRNGGNLMQAREGVDIGRPNAPEQGSSRASQSTNYSDGYDPRNDPRNNQNYNPYLVNQHSFTNGYTPYMGIFGALANTAGRFGPKLKIKNKMYGDINYYGDQGASGQKSGDSSKQGQNITAQNNNPEGYTRYDEVIKRGIWNRLAPNKFAPKHVRTGWEKTGQDKGTNDINPAIGGTGSGSKTASNSAQSNSENAKKLYDEATARQNYIPTTPYMTNQAPSPMGPFQPSISPFIKPYEGTQPSMGPAAKSPFSSGFPGRAMGPGYAYGGVPQFVGGGTGTYTPHPDDVSNIYGGIGFNVDNLNPWQMEGAAQDFTGFLNNGQNQRIMNEQRERLQNPLSTTADLENRGNQRTFDSNIASNTRETPRLTTFAGDSNVDGQIGMSRYGGTMQGGGQVNINDEIDMDEDELEQFLANGGQVEYL
jgi:hypothetical protein